MMTVEEELRAFEAGEIEPADFPHREHVRFAYEMLGDYSLGETLLRFGRGLNHLARKAGKPQLYHETVTVAFLAIIAERRARAAGADDWATFIAANPDLLDKDLLLQWYTPEQLGSQLARTTFVLPTPRKNSR
jgi:hypothetical protein